MTSNVGNTDRVLRLVLGLALVLAPLLKFPDIWANAWLGYASMAIGAVLFVTAIAGYCPLYSIFGIRTCRKG